MIRNRLARAFAFASVLPVLIAAFVTHALVLAAVTIFVGRMYFYPGGPLLVFALSVPFLIAAELAIVAIAGLSAHPVRGRIGLFCGFLSVVFWWITSELLLPWAGVEGSRAAIAAALAIVATALVAMVVPSSKVAAPSPE